MYQIFNYMLKADGNLSEAFMRLMQKSGDLIFSAAPLAEDANRLLCNGAIKSRAEFPALFAAIGTTYGAGDGSTTFQIPDLRDKFPVGAGNTYGLGDTGGVTDVTLTSDQIPAHVHAIAGLVHDRMSRADLGIQAWAGSTGDGPIGEGAVTKNTGTVGGGTSHTNLPPYKGVYIYIKT